MNFEKWFSDNTEKLTGKTVAVTGTTGGLGRELCLMLAALGASLILVDRNKEKSERFKSELKLRFPEISVDTVNAELEDIASVSAACKELKKRSVDIFIHNAGAYSIPRHKTSVGFDNLFTINFVSPYYIIKELLPDLSKRGGRVIAVGSIAHSYSKSDPCDIDFSSRKKASLVYGNAKRYLMFSLFELFKDEKNVSLSIVHPGITFTNITAHYPKVIFALIKHPMKVIFMKPKKASLSIVKGLFEKTEYFEWIGPSLLNVWGCPKKKRLKTVSREESAEIFERAEKIYSSVKGFVK